MHSGLLAACAATLFVVVSGCSESNEKTFEQSVKVDTSEPVVPPPTTPEDFNKRFNPNSGTPSGMPKDYPGAGS